jgi:hypothetical protein
MTPFRAVYGRDPPALIRYDESTALDPPDIQQLLVEASLLVIYLVDMKQLQKRQIKVGKEAWFFLLQHIQFPLMN